MKDGVDTKINQIESDKNVLSKINDFTDTDICFFVNSDFNIILDEIDSFASLSVALSTMLLIICLLLIISIFFGIMSFNKFTPESKKEEVPKDNTNNPIIKKKPDMIQQTSNDLINSLQTGKEIK